MKKRIGISTNILIMEGSQFPGMYRAYVNNGYVLSLEKADCIPVLLPVIDCYEDIPGQISGLDGIVLSGGYDVDPVLYNEQPLLQQGFSMKEVDLYYIHLVQCAHAAGIPLFGICKGMQICNVAFGGSLYQDIGTQRPNSLLHVQKAPRYTPSHYVSTTQGSFINKACGERFLVNSFHHQAVKEIASGFVVTAQADDGTIEAIESTRNGSFICGVQFHPEMMAEFDNDMMINLFRAFAGVCTVRPD